jgi:hypothetical protein
MFGLFRARCPVEPDARAWIEERTLWLLDQFGAPRLKGVRVILPSPAFFPDKYDASRQAAGLLFERVRGYMGLAETPIRLGFYTESRSSSPGVPGVLHESRGTAGLFHGASGSPEPGAELTIQVETRQLAKPMSLVATVAHELGHVHLIGHGRIKGDVPDNEPLTDLVTIFLGLGIFTANSLFQEENSRNMNRSTWSAGSQGYLTQLQAGYALALFAWLRGDDRPDWTSEVCADVREPLKAGLRFLHAGNPSPALFDARARVQL